jgi:dynein heavy chain
MSLYNTFNITNPSAESTQSIYNSILRKSLSEFPEEVQLVIEPMTQATIKFYLDCKEKLPRTPSKFHYTFNLRDLSRIYEGLYLATIDKIATKGQLVRLWRNECLRVIADRLIDNTDKSLVTDEMLPSLVKQFFKDVEEEVSANPILFGDYRLTDPEDPDSEDPRLYEDLGSFAEIREKMEKILEDYNFNHLTMNLVLFSDCLDHINKCHRIIRFPKGSGLLVGFGGSGKQSVTKIATYLATYDLY